VNFEFLRRGDALTALCDDLRNDLWDRKAIRQRIRDVSTFDWKASMHPISDQLLKVYTSDLMLRKTD
jgi:hypothetical protein